MSQVPNRYFNNQVLQDVGRNLSLAIAGDPEREAARLDMKMREAQMKRQADADAMAAEQRGKQVEANQFLSRIFEFGDEEVEAKRALAGNYINLVGADPTLFQAMGTASPLHDAKAALLQENIAGKLSGIEKQIAGMDVRDIRGNDTRRHIANQNFDATMEGHRLRYLGTQLTNATRERIAKLTDANGKPLSLPKDAHTQLAVRVLMMAKATGAKINPADLEDVVEKASLGWQADRNPVTAVNNAWRGKFGAVPQIQEEDEGLWGFFKGDSTLVPIDAPGATPPAAPAAGAPLSSVVAPGGPRPAAAPAPIAPTAVVPTAAAPLSAVVAPPRAGTPGSMTGRGMPPMRPAAPPAPARAPITVRVAGKPEVLKLIAAGKLIKGDSVILPTGETIEIDPGAS